MVIVIIGIAIDIGIIIDRNVVNAIISLDETGHTGYVVPVH